jgi:PAS domain S-box-containing protein
LYSLLENTEDSIYIVDKNHNYLLVNQELLKRLGLPRDEIIGKSFDLLHNPEETEVFTEKIDWVFHQETPTKEEHKSDKLGQWFLRTYSPIKDWSTKKLLLLQLYQKISQKWKKQNTN